MLSPITKTWRNLWQAIRDLFRRRRSLSDFSLDELRVEQVRLEAAEQRIVRELERLEREKAVLFEAATHETSQPVRVAMAGKIRNIDQRVRLLQGDLTQVGRLLRLVAQLINVKEAGQIGSIGEILNETDTLELLNWIEQRQIERDVTTHKLEKIAQAFEEARKDSQSPFGEDLEVKGILAQIELARAAMEAVEESNLTGAESQAFRRPEPPSPEM